MLHIFGIKEIIEEKFNEYESKILNCNYDYDRLYAVYEKNILNMTPHLEDILQENFYGASINRNERLVFSKCNTINDILHALHFYVVNNEQYYRGMPVINSKKNSNGYNIVLYGKENELADGLFDNFPDTMDVGSTDILSFDNRMMIMVRDKGHALSLDITKEDDKYRVSYFIPKVCNVEKVNQLRGVTKLNPETSNSFNSTKGEFVVNRGSFSSEIIDFIDCVPTDSDMIIKSRFPGFM